MGYAPPSRRKCGTNRPETCGASLGTCIFRPVTIGGSGRPKERDQEAVYLFSAAIGPVPVLIRNRSPNGPMASSTAAPGTRLLFFLRSTRWLPDVITGSPAIMGPIE